MPDPVDAPLREGPSTMPTVDPVRDLSHTISVNGTNNPAPAPPKAEEPSKPRRKYGGWLLLFLLGVLGFAGFRYWQEKQAKAQAAAAAQANRAAHRAVPVVAVPARVGDVPVYLRGLGTVTAFNTVTVKSRVDGQLLAVHFQERQFAKKGDLLAEIDPRPWHVQL